MLEPHEAIQLAGSYGELAKTLLELSKTHKSAHLLELSKRNLRRAESLVLYANRLKQQHTAHIDTTA